MRCNLKDSALYANGYNAAVREPYLCLENRHSQAKTGLAKRRNEGARSMIGSATPWEHLAFSESKRSLTFQQRFLRFPRDWTHRQSAIKRDTPERRMPSEKYYMLGLDTA